MKKLAVLKCSVCKREIEHEVDNTRITPVKCTITRRCVGVLSISEYRNVRTAIHPATSQEYQDWIKRGTPPAKREPVSAKRLSVKAGLNHLVMIVPTGSAPSQFDLGFSTSIVDGNSRTIQYYYVRGSNTVAVSGPDDSVSREVMRITSSDLTKVFVNSELIIDYTVEIDPVTLNSRIAFDSPLTAEKSIITVLVYKPSESEDHFVTFSEAAGTTGSAWGNIRKVEIDGVTYDVYVADDLSGLSLGGRYVLSDGTNTGRFLLVANKPYSSFDRLTTTVVSLERLTAEMAVFEYAADKYSEELITVLESDIDEVFPPIRIVERDPYSPDFVIETEGLTRSEIGTTKVIGPV